MAHLALNIVRLGRWLFRGTPVQRLRLTTWCYRRVARAIVGEERLTQLTFRGVDLLAPAGDITITPTLLTGDYERTALDAFLRILPPGGTVIDVGSNIGIHSVLAATTMGPAGRVIAFEPVRENRELAALNADRNGVRNIRTVDKAVGNTEGTLTLYHSEAYAGTHSAGLRSGRAEEVAVVSLDDWVAQADIDTVDALKIDVEGFDGFVLDGARKLIESSAPSILVEYVPAQLEACGDDPHRMAQLLTSLPGACLAIDERRRCLVPVSTADELAAALGAGGGNVLVTPSTALVQDLIRDEKS